MADPNRTDCSHAEDAAVRCLPPRPQLNGIYSLTLILEIFARILFLRIKLKDLFAIFKNRDFGMIFLHQKGQRVFAIS